MNHPLASSLSVGNNNGDGGSDYWESSFALLLAIGTILHSLVIPLLVAIGVQFMVQFIGRVRRDAGRQLQRHAESLERDRLRLIEEIKFDLLKTLNKGSASSEGASPSSTPASLTTKWPVDRKPAFVRKELSHGTTASPRVTTGQTIAGGVRPNGSRNGAAVSNSTTNKATSGCDWRPRRLDRKECSNIVNEIIYQIQSGSRNEGEDVSRQTDGGSVYRNGARADLKPGNAEDSAILRDVHKRNVVARMKTLFEQQQSHPTALHSPVKRPPAELPLRHFSSVVNILRRNEANSSTRSISTSLENLRPPAGQFLKATSEPPTVIRLRRRIRSQQSLSESVDDILESERFSKRLSQYSISDLLDEDDRGTFDETIPNSTPPSPPDRVSKGLKTLSTFSLSELLRDEESDTAVDGVVLRRSISSSHQTASQPAPSAAYRNAVDNIEQILIAENLSKDYWKYSISNLLDCMEEDDGGVVCLQEYN
uniref:Uncharacterized protein n=1 Tax=Anopheles atroparvus TaxID=41427 RepID=A0AAG5DET3_ANOAO